VSELLKRINLFSGILMVDFTNDLMGGFTNGRLNKGVIEKQEIPDRLPSFS
jgi:hypothetical protein